jgi:hypothetical protein
MPQHGPFERRPTDVAGNPVPTEATLNEEALNTAVANLARAGFSADDIQDFIANAFGSGEMVYNEFCGTGPEGGVDPTCSPGQAKGGGAGGGSKGKAGFLSGMIGKAKRALGLTEPKPGSGDSGAQPAGQKDFAGPHDSQAVHDLMSGKAQHDLHFEQASSRADTMLTAIMKESGRDGVPQKASAAEIDALAKKGWFVGYRGVGDAKYAQQFKDGPMYNGAGSYGNGNYFTYGGQARTDDEARSGAQMYAGQNAAGGSSKGAVIRVAFPPGARIADHETLKKERSAFLKDLSDKRFKGQMSKEDYEKQSALHSDMGRFAALRNYDAIRIKHEGFLVLLNRGKAVVEQ